LRILTITKSAEFQKIGKKNTKFYSKTVLLLSSPTPSFYLQDLTKNKNAKDFCRVGYTVSKVVGNAVNRNLAKRRLREIVRDLMPKYAKLHHDYVLIVRKEIAAAEFKQIENDLKFCLKKIHQNSNPVKL
jgi:ribonuclease P protein component